MKTKNRLIANRSHNQLADFQSSKAVNQLSASGFCILRVVAYNPLAKCQQCKLLGYRNAAFETVSVIEIRFLECLTSRESAGSKIEVDSRFSKFSDLELV